MGSQRYSNPTPPQYSTEREKGVHSKVSLRRQRQGAFPISDYKYNEPTLPPPPQQSLREFLKFFTVLTANNTCTV